MLSRRTFLQNSALALGAAGGLSPLGALAADRSGYKAIVCVYLAGGMDAHDILIGHDQPSYDGWASAREAILNRFADSDTPAARARDSLLRLDPLNASDFGSRAFAMPPEMAPLKNLFDDGKLAIVPNVGPLMEPVTRQQVEDKTALLPPRLQSHNDQESIWQAFATEGARNGWGGTMLDMMAQSSPYTAISVANQTVFLSGRETRHLQISKSGQIPRIFGHDGKAFSSSEASSRLMEYYRNAANNAANPMMRDIVAARGKAITDSDRFAELLGSQSLGEPIRTNGNSLSQQLATIANLIAARDDLGVNRQVFYAEMNGFDTHRDHHVNMPTLLTKLSEAIAGFQAVIDSAGLTNQVALFTASDFGRTLSANATGTDHGWGGHHIVVGGGVRGGRIHGRVPEFQLDHDRDYKRGAMIPEIAVEQYASELGRWFGLTESELDFVFERRSRFDRNALQLFL